jgi:hypothetical protein
MRCRTVSPGFLKLEEEGNLDLFSLRVHARHQKNIYGAL